MLIKLLLTGHGSGKSSEIFEDLAKVKAKYTDITGNVPSDDMHCIDYFINNKHLDIIEHRHPLDEVDLFKDVFSFKLKITPSILDNLDAVSRFTSKIIPETKLFLSAVAYYSRITKKQLEAYISDEIEIVLTRDGSLIPVLKSNFSVIKYSIVKSSDQMRKALLKSLKTRIDFNELILVPVSIGDLSYGISKKLIDILPESKPELILTLLSIPAINLRRCLHELGSSLVYKGDLNDWLDYVLPDLESARDNPPILSNISMEVNCFLYGKYYKELNDALLVLVENGDYESCNDIAINMFNLSKDERLNYISKANIMLRNLLNDGIKVNNIVEVIKYIKEYNDSINKGNK